MMGSVAELPNMQWRRRRMLRNATNTFLHSEEYKAMQERNKAERDRQIDQLFDRDIRETIEEINDWSEHE
jgi:hypothetical protein